MAKKNIGCQFSWRPLRAARATTTAQLLAKIHMPVCNANPADVPDVRPTAIEAKTPMSAATYSHSSVSDIIEMTRQRAMAAGIHPISR